ncbi:MAG: alpha/beta hydrolase [Pseudobutyrivibrio sp.]|uniref:alpha/beta hydrolase n=1 Tax=Pseudobutyrivibrio sp. TaxID=2014367 RepID=UPI0025D9CD21|nr:alpha/beta hydrolase [Pseudobutyrivibrio sp.]MBE5903191.1 alpha/beta hydrolase [Pseudobutyrivibrio sp.]
MLYLAGIFFFVCCLVGILLLLCRQIGYLVLYLGFKKRIEPTESQKDYSFVVENSMNKIERFIGEDDNRRKIYLFQNDNKSLVVFSMGYGSFAPDYKQTITSLVKAGYDVLTFDAKAHGESGGKSPLGYPQFVLDLKSVIETIDCGYSRVMLLGHSIGAYAVLSYLKDVDTRIKAVAAVAPVNRGDVFAISVYERFPCIFTKQMVIGAQKYERKRFGQLSDLSAVDGVNSTDIPVLILQGDQDELVFINTCSMVKYKDKLRKQNVDIKVVKDGKHDLLKENDVNQIIIDFFNRYQI